MLFKGALEVSLLLPALILLAGCGGDTPPRDFLDQEVFIPNLTHMDPSGITVQELCNFYQPTCAWEALAHGGEGYVMRVTLREQLTGEEHAIAFQLAFMFDKARAKKEVQITGILRDGQRLGFAYVIQDAWTIANSMKQLRAN